MEESTTYQGLLRRGAVAEARKMLLRIGELQIGTPASTLARKAIDGLETLDELEQLTERALTAESWETLLGLPAPKLRRRRG